MKSNAKTAIKYNYKKPIIEYDNNSSYVNVKGLRHPIIERIIDSIELKVVANFKIKILESSMSGRMGYIHTRLFCLFHALFYSY